ncbi:reverse transcriptase domain-containing protein [Tanacetum coccineum]
MNQFDTYVAIQSDFALGAVLGAHVMIKHFRPITYASKTMNEAESRYTTTEKEMLAEIPKADIAPMGTLLPEFDFRCSDTESTAMDYLTRNYHAGNYRDQRDTTQQKRKFFKDVKPYFLRQGTISQQAEMPYKIPSKFVKSLTSGALTLWAKSHHPKQQIHLVKALNLPFSKWVEAKALPTNDARVVVKFLKALFARFETPRAIISDRGTHFSYDQLYSKVEANMSTPSTFHCKPSTNKGQLQVSNPWLEENY